MDSKREGEMSEKQSEGLPPPASAQTEAKNTGGLHSSVYIAYVNERPCGWRWMSLADGSNVEYGLP